MEGSITEPSKPSGLLWYVTTLQTEGQCTEVR